MIDAPKLYFLQKNKSACQFCSFLSTFYCIGDNISADNFKDEIAFSLKENDRLKFSQDMAINSSIEKGEP